MEGRVSDGKGDEPSRQVAGGGRLDEVLGMGRGL